jgi:CDP-glucose 4,6-dehydratase
LHKMDWSLFKNKKVFLTGHTGFKGSWMLQILHMLGADVKGYALSPEHEQDLYHQIDGDKLCYSSVVGNVLDAHLLHGEMVRFQPDYVFHFAAQALVRRSYLQPVDTFAVNVMGTVNVLEAMRSLEKPCVGIMVTTDKVYENNEMGNAFEENDKLGGYDPYSASKAAAEIAISAYRNAYFNPAQYASHQKSIAAVRAGNVIGGGDYSEDRIIPDIVRAIQQQQPVTLRAPKSVRPWQHVLDPLLAYLMLAQKMTIEPIAYASAYNIGPEVSDALDVETVTQHFIQSYGSGTYQIAPQAATLHEAKLLMLDNTKLKETIGWQPLFHAYDAIAATATWYANTESSASEKCQSQIKALLFN